MNSNNQLIKSVCRGVLFLNMRIEEHVLEILFSQHLYSFKMRIKFDRIFISIVYFYFNIHISKKI